jgi:hypothetical protein
VGGKIRPNMVTQKLQDTSTISKNGMVFLRMTELSKNGRVSDDF